jgi:hypothetical protein
VVEECENLALGALDTNLGKLVFLDNTLIVHWAIDASFPVRGLLSMEHI